MNREELDLVVAYLRTVLKPYRDRFPRNAALPPTGLDHATILAEIDAMAAAETPTWRSGHASGAVYQGDEAWMTFLDEVYARNAELNPLHPDLWPRATRFEAEVVAMTADVMGDAASPTRDADGGVAGLVTSGGTDSILTAVRCARDHWRGRTGWRPGDPRPTLVMPTSAHVAFDKAAHYFDLTAVRVPVGSDGVADVAATTAALDGRTAILAATAGTFPHGVVDPVPELAEAARSRGVWFHTDACLGGFVLPFAERLGEEVPTFDFRLPGVSSLSVDTHKYGYAAKGSSVLLFRNAGLRRLSYFRALEWPGGLYNSPSAPGSRPGALVAQAWAAMLAMGEDGYLEAARRVVATTRTIREGLAALPGIRLLGSSLLVVAFTADGYDPYALQDALSARGWSLTGLQRPPGLHLTVTLRTAQDGVAERLLADVAAADAELRADPGRPSLMAPIYGLGAAGPLTGSGDEVDLATVLGAYLDVQYEV